MYRTIKRLKFFPREDSQYRQWIEVSWDPTGDTLTLRSSDDSRDWEVGEIEVPAHALSSLIDMLVDAHEDGPNLAARRWRLTPANPKQALAQAQADYEDAVAARKKGLPEDALARAQADYDASVASGDEGGGQ